MSSSFSSSSSSDDPPSSSSTTSTSSCPPGECCPGNQRTYPAEGEYLAYLDDNDCWQVYKGQGAETDCAQGWCPPETDCERLTKEAIDKYRTACCWWRPCSDECPPSSSSS